MRVARFAAVGASGYGVNLGVFAIIVRAGTPATAAAAASFVAAVANNYGWNRVWTFRARGSIAGQGARFAGVSVATLVVNLAALHLLLAGGARAVPAQAAAIVITMPLNYLGNRLWTFAPAAPGLRDLRAGAYARILVWWGLSRALVFATALVVQALRWPRPGWYVAVHMRPLALLEAWDGRWYRMVADRGYLALPHRQSDTAFFPFYPATVDGVHALGVPLQAAALLVANAGFVLGLIALYELARTWLPEKTAERTAVYAALFPIGYVFSMEYPEGMVLAAVAGAGAAAARSRWTLAAAVGAIATLGRPEGVFVALPLAALALRRDRRPVAFAAAAAPVVALAAVAAYQRRMVGDPLAFSTAQHAWGRRFELAGVQRAVHELLHAQGQNLWLARDAAFCALYMVLLVVALRAGVPLAWVVAGALIVLLPLESGSFTSDARFGLLAPAAYAGLAVAGRRRLLDLALRPAMLCLLGAATATILLRWP